MTQALNIRGKTVSMGGDEKDIPAFCIPLIIAPAATKNHFEDMKHIFSSRLTDLLSNSAPEGFVRNTLKFVLCHQAKTGLSIGAPLPLASVIPALEAIPHHRGLFSFTALLEALNAKKENLPTMLGAIAAADRVRGDTRKDLKQAAEDFELPVITMLHRRSRDGARRAKPLPGFTQGEDVKKLRTLAFESGVVGAPVPLRDAHYIAFENIVTAFTEIRGQRDEWKIDGPQTNDVVLPVSEKFSRHPKIHETYVLVGEHMKIRFAPLHPLPALTAAPFVPKTFKPSHKVFSLLADTQIASPVPGAMESFYAAAAGNAAFSDNDMLAHKESLLPGVYKSSQRLESSSILSVGPSVKKAGIIGLLGAGLLSLTQIFSFVFSTKPLPQLAAAPLQAQASVTAVPGQSPFTPEPLLRLYFRSGVSALNQAQAVSVAGWTAYQNVDTCPRIEIFAGASKPGPAQQNMILSAFRGEAVRKRAADILPSDRLVVFAQGEENATDDTAQSQQVFMVCAP